MAKVYDIYMDADSDTLTEIGFNIMKAWFAFAIGTMELHGHRVQAPTGRMASNIRMEGRGPNHVAVIADTPEAEVLEEGSPAIDLKQTMQGRVIPLHRGVAGQYGSAGYGAPVISSAFSARANNVWAAPRAEGFTGMRTVGDTGWVIPAFAAWSPAQALKDMTERGDFTP